MGEKGDCVTSPPLLLAPAQVFSHAEFKPDAGIMQRFAVTDDGAPINVVNDTRFSKICERARDVIQVGTGAGCSPGGQGGRSRDCSRTSGHPLPPLPLQVRDVLDDATRNFSFTYGRYLMHGAPLLPALPARCFLVHAPLCCAPPPLPPSGVEGGILSENDAERVANQLEKEHAARAHAVIAAQVRRKQAMLGR